MIFSSIIFLFFYFPMVLSLYFLCPANLRNLFLFFVSLVFYAWSDPTLVFVIVAAIALNYLCALLIDNGWRKIGLIASLTGNLGMLGFFKYFDFLAENLGTFFDALHLPATAFQHHADIALPLGISFYTFKALSYIIDVYWGETTAEKNFIDFGMFMSMFPQLVAGPIGRYVDIAAQLRNRTLTSDGIVEGIRRFILGLGKKVLIASTLAVPADQIFRIPAEHLTPGLAWLGLMCYTLQIYFDFSGYSDMAIGIGKMFGFDVLENFNYPYISRSVQEFWTRWHISLSTWFRDYLYLPLAFSDWGRVSPRRMNMIVLFVFLVTGLWHGAAWTFVLWGVYYGVFLVIERVWLGKKLTRIWRPVAHLYTLLVVMVGWVLFRAETLSFALSYLQALIGVASGDGTTYSVARYLNHEVMVIIGIGIIGAMPIGAWLRTFYEIRQVHVAPPFRKYLHPALAILHILFLFCLFLLSAMPLANGTYNPFIYFKF